MFVQLRKFGTGRAASILECLKTRKLIRISGKDVSDFLQGLITNDVRHLDHGMGCMYAMFLNTKGRILFDTLVYKPKDPDTYLLECDSEALVPLQKHLKIYRVRRKIDIVNLENDFHVYVLFDPREQNVIDDTALACQAISKMQPANTQIVKIVDDAQIYNDPRMPALGRRIIAPVQCNIKNVVAKFSSTDANKLNFTYRKLRYKLGVGEGVDDLPPNDSFPLEANCDFLHGVSFHKGCYIGQELTARTFHTGVVRKRLMPIHLAMSVPVPDDKKIWHNNVNLGKLRGIEDNVGLALLRVAQVVELKNINIGTTTATTKKPRWWPLEAPKEKMTA